MNLLDQIKDAGIIGAGGAGFPTHAKLTSEAEYILMNGAECEPLLRVDQQLMAIYPDEIIKGFAEAGRLVNAKKQSSVSRVNMEKSSNFLKNGSKLSSWMDTWRWENFLTYIRRVTSRCWYTS